MNMKQWIKNFLKDRLIRWRILEKWFGIRAETKEFYAQFGEDASLQTYFSNRAWSRGEDPAKLAPGFYVDIGCYSPIRISNTFWFYKRGWRGINVDLSTETIEAFRWERPHDVNLAAAITNQTASTEIEFFEFGASSVYNTLDAESARETEQRWGIKPKVNKIQALSLTMLFDRYLPAGQTIQFITVDAEGHDLEILKSNDWDRYRPEAIIVEIHEPDFHKLGSHPTVQYLENLGYDIYSWLNPSVIFSSR